MTTVTESLPQEVPARSQLDAVDTMLGLTVNHPVKMLSLLCMAREPDRDHTEAEIYGYLFDAQDTVGPRHRTPALGRLLMNGLVAADLAVVTHRQGPSGNQVRAFRLTEKGQDPGPAVCGNNLDLELCMPAFSSQRVWGLANNDRSGMEPTIMQPLFRMRMLQRLLAESRPLSIGDFHTPGRVAKAVTSTIGILETEGVLEVLRKSNPAHRRLAVSKPNLPQAQLRERLRKMPPQEYALYATARAMYGRGVRDIDGRSLLDEALGGSPSKIDPSALWERIVDSTPPYLAFADRDIFGDNPDKKTRVRLSSQYHEPISWLFRSIDAIRVSAEYRDIAAAQGRHIIESPPAVSYLLNAVRVNAVHSPESVRQEAESRAGGLRARIADWVGLPQQLTFGPEWALSAACRDYSKACSDPEPNDPYFEDPDLFFPLDDYRPVPRDVAAAKKVCGDCAMRLGCLKWAREKPEQSGVWGGLTAQERRTAQLPAGMLALLDMVELPRQPQSQLSFSTSTQ